MDDDILFVLPESLGEHGIDSIEKFTTSLLSGWFLPLCESTDANKKKEWSHEEMEDYFTIEERLKILFEPVDRFSFERATALAKMLIFMG